MSWFVGKLICLVFLLFSGSCHWNISWCHFSIECVWDWKYSSFASFAILPSGPGDEVSLSFSITFFVSVSFGALLIVFLVLSLIAGTSSSSCSVCFISSSSFCLDWNFSLKCLCAWLSIFVFLLEVFLRRFV